MAERARPRGDLCPGCPIIESTGGTLGLGLALAAVRACLAADAGERRVEAFALFNVFYQAGILIGPLVGMLLTGFDFRITCLVSAAVFALLSVVRIRSPPTRRADDAANAKRDGRERVLATPLEVRRSGGDGEFGTAAVAVLFAASGLARIFGQTG